MHAEMDEHARARAETELKNAKLEEDVQMLKEQVRNETIERVRINEERDHQMEERNAATMESAMKKLKEEMKAIVAKKNQQQRSDDGNRPNTSRAMFQNPKPNGSTTYISSHNLKSLQILVRGHELQRQ